MDALGPFLEWARAAEERGPAANARHDGRPVVGIFCSFVPAEIVLACGATPVRLCAGSYHLDPVAEASLGRDACPVVKSTVSWLQRAQPDARPDLIIAPASCDWKAKLTTALDGSLPVLELNVPHRRDVQAFTRELSDLTARLGELTDSTATRRTLTQARQAIAETEDELRALHQLRRGHPPALQGSQAMLMAQTLGLVPPRTWAAAAREAVEAAKARQPSPPAPLPQGEGGQRQTSAGARLLLSGSPVLWPNFKVPELIRQAGGEIVAEDFCSRMGVLYEKPGVKGREVMGELAQRCTSPCACAAQEGDRRALVSRLLHDFAVTGIIVHMLKGCAPVAMDVAAMRRLAVARAVPLIEIETDYGREDVEPLRTRLETFVEMTAVRKPA